MVLPAVVTNGTPGPSATKAETEPREAAVRVTHDTVPQVMADAPGCFRVRRIVPRTPAP